MSTVQHLRLSSDNRVPLLRSTEYKNNNGQDSLPAPKQTHCHLTPAQGDGNATVFFIGTATTIIDWRGFRILTDPNFLHAGDHVHLGPGVNATRRTNPAIDLHDIPFIDCLLLSHYHEDHFDKLVEDSINRDFPIITTSHAARCLTEVKDEPFRNVQSLKPFESLVLDISSESRKGKRMVKVTGTPGRHVPPGPLSVANNMLGLVPPTNGWLLELGHEKTRDGDVSQTLEVDVGYRIYISGDTLFVDELKDIPKLLESKRLDLMLVHLGGTSIPGPDAPLLMVTMDAKQGVQLLQLMKPDVTIPIHYDDYSVFKSPLSDFRVEVEKAGLKDRVVYLDRGEAYRFAVPD